MSATQTERISSHVTHRNTWRLSSTLYLRYYSNTDKCYWIRSSSMYETRSKRVSLESVKLMVEYNPKISYGLQNNTDVFFNRSIPGGGGISLGYDHYRNLKLFISSIGTERYEKGSAIAINRDEYGVFMSKSERIIGKMKVCIYVILNY